MKRSILFGLLLSLTIASRAEEIIQHETFAYGERMTFDEGCNLAEQSLKRRAVAQQCGSMMTGSTLRALGETTDVLYRLHFETTGGRVISYQAISRRPEDAFSCTVSAKVTVKCDQGQRDPAFLPATETLVKLNETVFRPGESLKISINIPNDLQGQAHLNVVVLMPYEDASKRVARVYPNIHEIAAPLTAGSKQRIPGNNQYDMSLGLPKDRNTAEEALMFIFSRRPVSLPTNMSIERLHSILAEIPLNERRELVMTYRIDAGKPQH